MTKTLNVIKPFMHLVPGDTFELNEDGSYTAKQHDEFTRTDDSGDFKSSLTSEFTVSADYMKEMAEEGIVDMDEPRPTEEQMNCSPRIKWLDKIPMYLFI